jgi:hypothetical protein
MLWDGFWYPEIIYPTLALAHSHARTSVHPIMLYVKMAFDRVEDKPVSKLFSPSVQSCKFSGAPWRPLVIARYLENHHLKVIHNLPIGWQYPYLNGISSLERSTEVSMEHPQKIKNTIAMWSSNDTCRYIPKRTKGVPVRHLHTRVHHNSQAMDSA